jgi:addiction module HigA family antidote
MPMKNPPHPGLSVRLNCLEPLGLSVSEGAKVLGVSRTTLSCLVNERAGISPEMAIRLSKAFGTTPEIWIRMQASYDIAQARQHEDEIRVARYEPVLASAP